MEKHHHQYLSILEEHMNKYKIERHSIEDFKPVSLKAYGELKGAQGEFYAKLHDLQQQHNELFKLSKQLDNQNNEKKKVYEGFKEIKKCEIGYPNAPDDIPKVQPKRLG